jgi:flagellar biosynthesis/type III secretory pathway chaperone
MDYKMEMAELNQMLEENKMNLENFLQVLSEQQKYLVDNNIHGLEGSIVKEEKLLSRIEDVKKKTSELISVLIEKYSIETKGTKLSDFVNAIKDKIKIDATVLLQKKIFELANQVKEMNQQNKILIEHARSFIKATVKALSDENCLILDRKV